MICRLNPDNLLYQHARNFFSGAVNFRGSWFLQIRKLCLMYSLPHPSVLFQQALPKERFKSMMKKKIIVFWEILLRKEANSLKSLTFFKPQFMSVVRPHPLWETAGHSPIKVAMATIQALFLSGRYRCGKLTRHWSAAGDGSCSMSSSCSGSLEDIPLSSFGAPL